MLPEVIETILSMERLTGGQLAEMGGTITNVPAFPPNTTLITTVTPNSGTYALIIFYAATSPSTIPDTFDLYVQHAGHGLYGGNWSALPIASGVPGWAVVTQATPFVVTAINQSGLTQRAEMGYFYAVVYTEDDYVQIIKMLKDKIGQGNVGWRQKVIAFIDKLERVPISSR